MIMSRGTMLELTLYLSGLVAAGAIIWLAPTGSWIDWLIASAILLSDIVAATIISRRIS